MHPKYNTRGAENATMSDDLKIKPEFRDLIPKLTDEEFAQLEENILKDGVVREPIVVWDGYIVDGHHRWSIVQKHPEIPYTIEEKDFENEHAAMAWACASQRGRRNISSFDKQCLLAKQYDEEKLAQGRPSGKSSQLGNISEPQGRTVDKVAKDAGVGSGTVSRADRFLKGVNIADEIVPGLKEDIRQGRVKVPDRVIQKIYNAEPEKQKRAVKLIAEGESRMAWDVLNGDADIIDSLHSETDVNYSEDDLKQELEANFDKAMDSLKTTRETYYDLLGDPEVNNRIIDFLIELHEAEIIGLREEKINESI